MGFCYETNCIRLHRAIASIEGYIKIEKTCFLGEEINWWFCYIAAPVCDKCDAAKQTIICLGWEAIPELTLKPITFFRPSHINDSNKFKLLEESIKLKLELIFYDGMYNLPKKWCKFIESQRKSIDEWIILWLYNIWKLLNKGK